MRQQYGTGRPGTTIFPSVTANTTAATPRHTRPIVSAHSTTQPRLAPYNLALPLLAPCVPPLRDTRTLHRHCSNCNRCDRLSRSRTPAPHRPDTSDHPADTGPRPAPSTASPLRRAPTHQRPPQLARPIQGTPLPPNTDPTPSRCLGPPRLRRALPRLSAVLQRSNSLSQRSRSIQDTPLPPNTDPTPSRCLGPPRRHRATPRRQALPRLSAGPQRSTSPSRLTRAIQGTPLPPHNGPHTIPTPRTTPPAPGTASPRRRAQKNPALRAGPIHLSVIFQ